MASPTTKVFYNGNIYSMDADRSVFTSMVVREGEISEVSASDSIISKLKGQESIEFIDLGGRTVFPAFSDSHIHAPGLAYDVLFNQSLYDALSKEETLSIIKNHVVDHPEKEIYYLRGVNSNYFGGEEKTAGPKKFHLDNISTEKPIIISDFGGNYLWMNSRALDLYGITPLTICPGGGEIPIDPDNGSLWGILRGEARSLIPYQHFSSEENLQAARWFQKVMLSNGYTSVFALRPPGTVEPRTTLLTIFRELEDRGELFLRVRGARDMDPAGDIDLQLEEMNRIRSQFPSGQIQFDTAKFFVDGTVEGADAFLLEPYESAAERGPEYRGLLIWNREKLSLAFRRCIEEGFRIHCHTIGDGAVRVALDAFEAAIQDYPHYDVRPVFTHLQLVDPSDIRRMKKNNIIADVQSYWHFKSPAVYRGIEQPLLGERAETQYPLGSFFKENIIVTASSDYPVTPDPNPFYAIQAGMTRNLYQAGRFGLDPLKDPDDPAYLLGKEERATMEEMIRAFTVNPAYSRFEEDSSGCLLPGKAADFIILDRDPFTTPTLEIEFIKIIGTYFKGREVYHHDQ